jgi:glycosyltransferase involved in cell wall biosynthesis
MNRFIQPRYAGLVVVIPSYRVRDHISKVIEGIGPEVSTIFVIDDCCPDGSGKYIEQNCRDLRVRIVYNDKNLGVGGAVMVGYRHALQEGANVIVKIDGDGQMDPSLILDFVEPIFSGKADYTKGNRFYNPDSLSSMPLKRLCGNAALSFITKFSSGYWDIFDPTNGYTAISATVLEKLPLKKISERYFFETDILFRLNLLRAVVWDIPMNAKYNGEVSNLKISKILFEFLYKNLRNFIKRIFYNYYLRDISIASVELPIGLSLFVFGFIFGMIHWLQAISTGIATPVGTIMLSAISLIMGMQLILAFLSYDISSTPKTPWSNLKLKR